MNQVQVFMNQEFGQLRVIDMNGQPWFVGKDIAEILGYKDTSSALKMHIDDEDKGVGEIPTPGGKQNVIIINESGLYSLILSSKLPGAKKFKRWVTSEVLPMIRQNGVYIPGNNLEEIATNGMLGINTIIGAEQNKELLDRIIKQNDELINLKRQGNNEAFDRYYMNRGKEFYIQDLYNELQSIYNMNWDEFKNIDWTEYLINYGYISYNKYTESYLQDNSRIISMRPLILTFKGFKEMVFNIKFNGKLKRYIK